MYDGGDEASYTVDLGRSLVTERVLRTLVEKGKVASLVAVHVPGLKTVMNPQSNEVVVFMAYFNVGLRLPSVELLVHVLWLFRVELEQLTPNSLVKLGVFEWIMRSTETSGEVRLFANLHDGRCQPKRKKSTNEFVNFDNVNFQLKESKLMYVPAATAQNQW